MATPGRSIRLLSWMVALLFVLPTVRAAAKSEWVTVRWVADGDTVQLQDRRLVIYIGVDTPERGRDRQPAERLADEARSVNRRLVEGWPLRLEFDRERRDRFHRILAYVYRQDGLFINAELVRQGVAHVLHRAPNTKMARILIAVQREAMAEKRGIWQFVDRDEKPPHPLRGNLNSKRFHSHACAMGKRITVQNRIDFTNPWTAFWEGYAPARECIDFPPEQ